MCRDFHKGAFTGMAVLAMAAGLAGCNPTYSPDTYASNAAQQANKVDQGVIVGVRAVLISADATLGTGAGGAAGGIAGSQIGQGAAGALGALGGSVAGGFVGNAVTHAEGDTNGFEYIVRKTNGDKTNGDLLSVTQKDLAPLGVGAHVLIIEGAQARIVPDYTVPVVVQPLHADAPKPDKPSESAAKPADALPAAAAQLPASAQIAAPPPSPQSASDTAGDKKPAAPADATPPSPQSGEAATPKPSGS